MKGRIAADIQQLANFAHGGPTSIPEIEIDACP
jgi:hypothetical protein